MTINQLSPHVLLQQQSPQPPTVSTLYALTPMGIGTSLVESMQSYLRRLAQAHCVRPFPLISYILDTANTSVRTLAYEQGAKKISQEVNWRGMSGLGKVARRWVDRLSELTGRSDLAYLSLLPYQHGLAESGLLRFGRAWCPYCYNHWHNQNMPVYDPLLWSVQSVTFCPHHRRRLVTTCPHCQQSPHHFGKWAQPGHCSFCGGWLGALDDVSCMAVPLEVDDGDGDDNFDVWVTRMFCHLLAAASDLEAWPQRGHLGLAFTHAFQTWDITLTEFARHLALPIGATARWIGKQGVPRTPTLLNFCWRARIDLSAILTQPPQSERVTICFEHIAREIITKDRKHKRLPFPDTFDLVAALKTELALTEVAQPLYVLAARLGCTTKQLRYREPALCDALVTRHQEWRRVHRPGHAPTALKKARARHQLEQVREHIQRLLEDDLKPPLKIEEVSRRVGMCTSSLYHYLPDLCKAITEKRKDWFDIERATQTLEHMMASQEHLPRLQDVAYSLGHACSTLKQKIPEVCDRFIQQRHKPLDVEAIRQTLADALSSAVEPPISLQALTRQLHLRRHTLERLFPDLTQALMQRYQSFRRTKAAERESILCEEVRTIARRLHAQRVLPSQMRVASLISCPSFMRQPMGVLTLRDERKILGIGRWQRYSGL